MTINYTPMTAFYDSAGSALTAGDNLMTAIKTAATANSGWTTAEDSVVGSLSFRYLALKCAAASSGLGADFYVLFVRSNVGAVNVFLGETYNTSIHTLGKFPPASGLTITPQSDGSVSSTIAPSANGTPTPSGAPTWFSAIPWAAGSASGEFFLVAYPDHLALYVASSAAGFQQPWYIGAFTSLVTSAATNDPMPVALVQMPAVSSVQITGSSTRHPLRAGASTSNGYALGSPVSNVGAAPGWAAQYPLILGLGYNEGDLMQGGTLPLSEALVFFAATTAATAATLGYLRGKYNNLRLMATPPSGGVPGDVFSYNGTHWVVLSSSSTVACLADTGA